jgi:hypothetical protein
MMTVRRLHIFHAFNGVLASQQRGATAPFFHQITPFHPANYTHASRFSNKRILLPARHIATLPAVTI